MLKPVYFQRKPMLFWCSACRKWIDDSVVTNDQTHERARGGCGSFVLSVSDVREYSKNAACNPAVRQHEQMALQLNEPLTNRS